MSTVPVIQMLQRTSTIPLTRGIVLWKISQWIIWSGRVLQAPCSAWIIIIVLASLLFSVCQSNRTVICHRFYFSLQIIWLFSGMVHTLGIFKPVLSADRHSMGTVSSADCLMYMILLSTFCRIYWYFLPVEHLWAIRAVHLICRVDGHDLRKKIIKIKWTKNLPLWKYKLLYKSLITPPQSG